MTFKNTWIAGFFLAILSTFCLAQATDPAPAVSVDGTTAVGVSFNSGDMNIGGGTSGTGSGTFSVSAPSGPIQGAASASGSSTGATTAGPATFTVNSSSQLDTFAQFKGGLGANEVSGLADSGAWATLGDLNSNGLTGGNMASVNFSGKMTSPADSTVTGTGTVASSLDGTLSPDGYSTSINSASNANAGMTFCGCGDVSGGANASVQSGIGSINSVGDPKGAYYAGGVQGGTAQANASGPLSANAWQNQSGSSSVSLTKTGSVVTGVSATSTNSGSAGSSSQ